MAGKKHWLIWQQVGWTATIALAAVLVWQTAVADALWLRGVSGMLLVLIGIVGGLHIGSQSAAAYTSDLQRLNKVLVDQNRELEAANAMLLKQLASQYPESSKSA